MSLAEARLVRSENQRHVGKLRQDRAQRLIKLDLPGRIGEMIVAANDVGDLHVDVVDDDTKVIGRGAVGAGDDQIVQLAVVEHDVAFDHILDDRRASRG